MNRAPANAKHLVGRPAPIRPGCTNASLASAPAGRVVATRTRNSNAAVASRPRGAGGGLRLVLELGVDHIVLAAAGGATAGAAAARGTVTAGLRARAGLLVHGLGELVGSALQLLERRAQGIRAVGVLVGLEHGLGGLELLLDHQLLGVGDL